MEIQKCYETLELTPPANLQEVQQAYKDLVNIWHPDRVQNNPRLQKKADEKLKAINAAYSELTSFLSSEQESPPAVRRKPSQPFVHDASRTSSAGTREQMPQTEPKPGPGFLSSLKTLLSKAIDGLAKMPASSRGSIQERPERFQPMGGGRRGRGGGMGQCAGRGRRGRGGMGRGKKRR